MTRITGPNGSIYADREKRTFKEPIGPISTNDALPIILARVLDVARIAIYKPENYTQERARLVDQLMGQYLDGQIQIPYDYMTTTYEQALEDYVDDEIAQRKVMIESGFDRSLFEVQLASVELMAQQLATHREQNRTLEKEKTALKHGVFDAHLYLSSLLTPEQLAIFDQKVGLKGLVSDMSALKDDSLQSFESVIEQSHGMPAGTLDATRLVKPPQSAEVELVDTAKDVS